MKSKAQEDFSTERCLLTVTREEHLPDLAKLWTDAAVREFLGGPIPIEAAFSRVQKYLGEPNARVVLLKPEHSVLGLVMLMPREDEIELSFLFLPQYWGAGFAYEATSCFLIYAKEVLGLSKVISVTQTANLRSISLLRRLGMRFRESFTEFGAAQSRYEFYFGSNN